MPKQDKPKPPESRAKRHRQRAGKKWGSMGGASPTRFYPRHGDRTDNLCRLLYNLIVRNQIPDPKNGAFGLEEK